MKTPPLKPSSCNLVKRKIEIHATGAFRYTQPDGKTIQSESASLSTGTMYIYKTVLSSQITLSIRPKHRTTRNFQRDLMNIKISATRSRPRLGENGSYSFPAFDIKYLSPRVINDPPIFTCSTFFEIPSCRTFIAIRFSFRENPSRTPIKARDVG